MHITYHNTQCHPKRGYDGSIEPNNIGRGCPLSILCIPYYDFRFLGLLREKANNVNMCKTHFYIINMRKSNKHFMKLLQLLAD